MMSLTERIEERIAPLHMAIVTHPLVRAIMGQKVTKDECVSMYVTLHNLTKFLEDGVKSGEYPLVDKIIAEEQFRSQILAADIQYLASTVPSNTDLSNYESALREHGGGVLLGSFYVLEGALSGGAQRLAAGIKNNFGLEATKGTGYLTGHGTQAKGVWAEFKKRLNETQIPPDMADEAENFAEFTFKHLAKEYRTIRPE